MTNLSEIYEIFLNSKGVITDSRKAAEGKMFFALKGDNFDGNLFAPKALEAGCCCAVIDNPKSLADGGQDMADKRYIVVADVLKTMQDLAAWHRQQFRGPVVQVTGTNGKTTTKELLTAVLCKKYKVLATQGNLNNHIGVPLTLLSLNLQEHEVAVVETGANHPGEIAFLTKIVQPDYGLITNIGMAHLEGFGSIEGVANTKGELFDFLAANGRQAFVNADEERVVSKAAQLNAISYGLDCSDEQRQVVGSVDGCAPFLQFRWKHGAGTWHEVQTHLIGAYNVHNALAAATVGVTLGVDEDAISDAIANYTPTNSRSEWRKTERNELIVDAYNANPTSMEKSLCNFIDMPSALDKMVIIGDMRELGEFQELAHQKMVDLLQAACLSGVKGIKAENVWLVGDNFLKTQNPFRCFKAVDEVEQMLKQQPMADKLILVKGSNGTKLFRLPELL